MTGLFDRLARRISVSPLVAILIAVLLLIVGLTLALQNDRLGKAEKLRQANVQAQILASSLSAPLTFDDGNAAQEYLNAFRLNPEILAAGAYDVHGRLVAGFSQSGAVLPKSVGLTAPAFAGHDLIVTARVVQGENLLGTVYLRSSIESWSRRAMRYLGIALLVVMASLLVAVLGASYSSLSEAHRKLQAEIDGRQQAEAALRQSQKMEAMGQMTGGVAHDFNNLLMVASSGLDLMERTTDPAKRERLRAGIRQAVDRGAKLTQQLLTFARRSPLHPEIVDVADRIRGMDTLLDRSLREDVVVELVLPDGLWPVEVDPSQLEVAVLNIALNARDAMPDGGTITIRARNIPADAADGADLVGISIADTGIGIAEDMIAKIFEPFFTTKGVGQGTGLGLSQVYGFARSSGGEVKVESEVGKGTTISLLVPRSAKTLAPGPADETPIIVAHDRPRHVLLVEDDDSVAIMVAEMLGELGYRHERVPSADAALSRLESQADVDLILSDMVMPGSLNGLDLIHAIAARWPDLPAILMTGYSAAAASASSEGVRLLLKPYRIEQLSAEIEAAITART